MLHFLGASYIFPKMDGKSIYDSTCNGRMKLYIITDGHGQAEQEHTLTIRHREDVEATRKMRSKQSTQAMPVPKLPMQEARTLLARSKYAVHLGTSA